MAVLITGICGRLGRLVARRLHRHTRVIGIDRRAFEGKPKDIVHHQVDMRRKKTRDVLRAGEVDTLMHLGIMHDPRKSDEERHSWNVSGFQNLLEYASQYGVKKVVVLSSANVYGPRPDNPQFLTEEAPLLGAQRFSAIRDLMEVDMLAQNFMWKHSEIETVVLRPVPHPRPRAQRAQQLPARRATRSWCWASIRWCRSCTSATCCAPSSSRSRQGKRGVYNIRGPGELPLSRAFQTAGQAPASSGRRAWPSVRINSLWRSRIVSFPAPELDHIRYVCMVDDIKARNELGYGHATTWTRRSRRCSTSGERALSRSRAAA